jgi:DNA-binding NarL/FixJ family response regulator
MCDDSYMAWTVLVVDDHSAFRASARRLLELDGFEVVGEAIDAKSGLQAAKDLRPDVILLDIGLPDRSGYEVAQQLANESVGVVLVSSRARSDLGRRAR